MIMKFRNTDILTNIINNFHEFEIIYSLQKKDYSKIFSNLEVNILMMQNPKIEN